VEVEWSDEARSVQGDLATTSFYRQRLVSLAFSLRGSPMEGRLRDVTIKGFNR
jgi:hypothetical protein